MTAGGSGESPPPPVIETFRGGLVVSEKSFSEESESKRETHEIRAFCIVIGLWLFACCPLEIYLLAFDLMFFNLN